MSILKNKGLLITGGTGSFGNSALRRHLDSDIKEIQRTHIYHLGITVKRIEEVLLSYENLLALNSYNIYVAKDQQV